MWCVEGINFERKDFEKYEDAEKAYNLAKEVGKEVVLREWDIEDSGDWCSLNAQKRKLTFEEWEECPCFI